MTKVFISYHRGSSALLAHLISDKLKSQGIETFVDVRDMDMTGPFPEKMREEIEKSDFFVCLLADKTLTSTWVKEEITHAYNLRKRLIPVLQESFVSPVDPQTEAIISLLRSNGVTVFDKQG